MQSGERHVAHAGSPQVLILYVNLPSLYYRCAYSPVVYVTAFGFFMSDAIIRVGFRPFWLRLPDPGPKPPDGNISLKLLLETRLEKSLLSL